LLSRGVDYREGDEKGLTPLMIAAKYGRMDNVALLLKVAGEKETENEQAEGVCGVCVCVFCFLLFYSFTS
jgi:ankyrin repeat protein